MDNDRLYITLSQHIINLYDLYDFFEGDGLDDESRNCAADNNMQMLEMLGIISVCRACEDNCIRLTDLGKACDLFFENEKYILCVPVELKIDDGMPF